MSDIARNLSAIQQGNSQAVDELLLLVYDERRKLAALKLVVHESPAQTLQATAHVGAALCPMSGWKQYLPVLFLVVALAVFLHFSSAQNTQSPNPQSLEDVIAIAKKLDLHFRSDTKDGVLGIRLIVSRQPLTWMRAGNLVLGRWVDSDWVGTVAVYQFSDITRLEEELDYLVPWGKLFLYGDRSLIKELTKQTDFDPMSLPNNFD